MNIYNQSMLIITKITNILTLILLSVMFILVFGQIITRYIIGSTPSFINELATYMLIWLTFIGSSLAVRTSKHVAIDILYKHIKSKIILVFINVISLTFLVILLLGMTIYAIEQWKQFSASMNIRMTWIILGSSVGIFLMILQQFEIILQIPEQTLEEEE